MGRRRESATAGRFPRVSRSLGATKEKLLWALAGGRCEAAGCNVALWKSLVSQERLATGENAHIIAFSEGGPRGDTKSHAHIHALSNLMLLCHACHRRIDSTETAERYPVELLRDWKRTHEARIELVTGIAPSHQSHVLSYGCRIGTHAPRWSYEEMGQAMFPERFPAGDPFHLGLDGSVERDGTRHYWELQLRQLQGQFTDFRRMLERSSIHHVSVFAMAPQPLLTTLGAMLGDLPAIDVYQRRREPTTWCMERDAADLELEITRPDPAESPPALVFSLSGTIERERVDAALGCPASIWAVTVPKPHNDIVTTPAQLRAFRRLMRRLLDDIKTAHGQGTMLHVFPAMPVSLAVELGRVRMPKAEMPWRLWDHLGERGFLPAIDLVGTNPTPAEAA